MSQDWQADFWKRVREADEAKRTDADKNPITPGTRDCDVIPDPNARRELPS